MSRLFIRFLIICLLLTLHLFPVTPHRLEADDSQTKHSSIPTDGVVPDKETAVRIAEAVLIPIYGRQQIESERPFNATLIEGIWIVEGTLPKLMLGGVAQVEISKHDGRILRITHGK